MIKFVLWFICRGDEITVLFAALPYVSPLFGTKWATRLPAEAVHWVVYVNVCVTIPSGVWYVVGVRPYTIAVPCTCHKQPPSTSLFYPNTVRFMGLWPSLLPVISH